MLKQTLYSLAETLFIKRRPIYLPRQIPSVILCAAYIPPEVNTKDAIDERSNLITQHENKHSGSFSIVLDDFNHTNLRKGLPKYYQHIDCTTRHDKILDHCYTTIKGSYRSLKRAPLGNADHNKIHRIPAYWQQLKREKPTKRIVPQWTEAAIKRFEGCLACTDWEVFSNSAA